MTLTYLSTFTGVGGFDLGFDRAGMTCLGMCEIDDKARAVLDHHWKDTPKHDDITTAITSGWADQFVGRTDVLIGGAPCQDLSVAGKRRGFDGERSVLFFDMVELAAYVGAQYIVYENVPGLLRSNDGRDFGAVLHALADAGFSNIEWRELDSQQFGVPQRRRRIFLVAHTPAAGGREVFPVGESRIGDLASIIPAWQEPPGAAEDGAGSRRWAGSAVEEEIAAPLLALTGGPRTTDIDGATFVAEATYWDGGQTSDCLDVSMLSKGQMLPEKRRMPAVLVPSTFSKKHRAASDSDYESWAEDNVSPTLNVFDNGDTRATSLVVGFNPQNGGGYGDANDGLAITPEGTGPLSTSQKVAVASQYMARRLTPVECERLQGFPDSWTDVVVDGKPMSDTQRYKQMGNAVTVNVAEYVGRLITAHAEASA